MVEVAVGMRTKAMVGRCTIFQPIVAHGLRHQRGTRPQTVKPSTSFAWNRRFLQRLGSSLTQQKPRTKQGTKRRLRARRRLQSLQYDVSHVRLARILLLWCQD